MSLRSLCLHGSGKVWYLLDDMGKNRRDQGVILEGFNGSHPQFWKHRNSLAEQVAKRNLFWTSKGGEPLGWESFNPKILANSLLRITFPGLVKKRVILEDNMETLNEALILYRLGEIFQTALTYLEMPKKLREHTWLHLQKLKVFSLLEMIEIKGDFSKDRDDYVAATEANSLSLMWNELPAISCREVKEFLSKCADPYWQEYFPNEQPNPEDMELEDLLPLAFLEPVEAEVTRILSKEKHQLRQVFFFNSDGKLEDKNISREYSNILGKLIRLFYLPRFALREAHQLDQFILTEGKKGSFSRLSKFQWAIGIYLVFVLVALSTIFTSYQGPAWTGLIVYSGALLVFGMLTSLRKIRSTRGKRINLYLPRLIAVVAIGFTPYLFVRDFYLVATQLEPYRYSALIFVCILVAFMYYIIEINRKTGLPWGKILKRAMGLSVTAFSYALLIGFFIIMCIWPYMAPQGISLYKWSQIPLLIGSINLGVFSPKMWLFYSSLALVSGILIQSIWEEKGLTEPF